MARLVSHIFLISNHERYKPQKVKKGKKKGDKTPAHTQTISSRLLPFLERNPLKPNHAFSLIFRLFKSQFLDHSCALGLINPTSLSLAGDGTSVKTAAFSRSKRICKCREQGINNCNCKRYFSQPDTYSCSGITPFIDLKKTNNGNYKYKDTFTIDPDGVPHCKFRYSKANRKQGCFCETPCSPAQYGRTVYTTLKDNPRIF